MDLWALADLATPWALHVAVTFRVAEHLAAGHTRIDDLAAAAGVHPGSLLRVLRHLVEKGVFAEPSPGEFALNDAARPLVDGGIRIGLDLNGFGGRMARAWATLPSAVRSGRPAYHEAFGLPFWDDLAAHPEIAADFDALMGPAGHGTPDARVLVDPADWESIRTVVDVGGGTGALLAEVLRAHPHLHGTLVDQPGAISRSGEVFAAAGVADRVTTVAQSFFDPLPPGRDLYLLKSVLSDWPDPEAAAILRRCAEAARPGGRVAMVNGVTPAATAAPELLMLVLVGGQDRTLGEFAALAETAGLTVTATGAHPGGRFLVECHPV
jgi:2,7-dihydroxy-5-methyl-1-naphthoate 7-O-methyltransferase